jgi:hypothetical protein
MLILKQNPKGVDLNIQKLQSFIHSKLIDLWQVSDNYECYGRASRNRTDDGYIAEILTSDKNYKEVYWNKALAAISFFGISTRATSELGSVLKTDAHLVFFVDLNKVKPSITSRADEEVRKDVINACITGDYGFTFESIETGLENVLKEYPGSRRDDRLKFIDMQPVHCFRLNFSLQYDINNC